MKDYISKFIDKWKDVEIEDYCGDVSPQYREFQKGYKQIINQICLMNNFNLCSFNGMHYCFSAVLYNRQSDKYIYISIPDVRFFKNKWCSHILYRSMENETDYRGGENHYTDLLHLEKNLIVSTNKI